MDKFINNIFCRRESNQYKARAYWDKVKGSIPNNVRAAFEIEWSHYLLGEFEPSQFGTDINKIKPYLTN